MEDGFNRADASCIAKGTTSSLSASWSGLFVYVKRYKNKLMKQIRSKQTEKKIPFNEYTRINIKEQM